MRARTFITVLLATLLALVAWVPTAQAANPHFMEPPPKCTITGTTVDCTGSNIAGVGNSDAEATLVVTYAGVVDCNNPGNNPNNPIESHETTFDVTTSSGTIEAKNGRLVVPPLSATARDLTAEEEATLCPNPNWEADLRDVEVVGYSYTISFLDRAGEPIEPPFYTTTG